MRNMLVLALALAFAPAIHADTIYKSVGPDGRVTYSQKPPAGAKIEKTLSYENLPATPLPDSVARYRDELQKSVQKRFADAGSDGGTPVIFTAVWCGYCRQAKAYLGAKGIAYREYDVETPDGMRAFAQAGGSRGVPLLVWKGRRVQGFSLDAYDSVFARPN